MTTTKIANSELSTASDSSAPLKEVGFLQEPNGKSSSMRVMSFISLIAAIVFGGLTFTMDGARAEGRGISFSFLVAAFAPKALQRFAEGNVLPR